MVIAPPVWRGARDQRFAGVVMTRRRDARPELRGGGEVTLQTDQSERGLNDVKYDKSEIDCIFTVHRQKVIGRYIADFYIAKYKTVIEIDGSQHYEKEGLEYDAERTAYFESLGMKVLRYTNREINRDFNSVCEDIKKMLGID